MLKNIDVKGYFYIPSKPDEQLPGTLKFSSGNGIRLDLFGQFRTYQDPSSSEDNIILGFTADGKKVTLLNCFQDSARSSFPGFPESSFSAIYLFVGQHFSDSSEIVFDKCCIEYSFLNHWLNVSGFEKPRYDEGVNEVNISYRRPDKISFELAEGWAGLVEFSFTSPVEYFIPKERVSIEQLPFITFLPTKRSGFKEFQRVYMIFTSWLALNYFNFPSIRELVFYESKVKEDEMDDEFNRVHLYYQYMDKGEDERPKNKKQDFLIQFFDFFKKHPLLIYDWFKLSDQIGPSINILTETFMGRGAPIEFQFLGIVQALENFHRTFSGNNRMHLDHRLDGMVKGLPAKIASGLLGNETKFVDRVTNNRNHFTHHSKNNNFIPASLGELFTMKEKLRVLFISIILIKLGLSVVEAEQVILIKSQFLFNHIVKREYQPGGSVGTSTAPKSDCEPKGNDV